MFENLFQSTISASLLVAIVVLLVLHFFYFSVQETRREPPGSKPLPLLGNLLQMDLKRIDKSLQNLSKKYGPVFTVSLGPKKVVVLSGYKAIKQALLNHAEEFGERDMSPAVTSVHKGNGIVFANGNTWKEMRKFALSKLISFGMRKNIIKEKILEECHYLIQSFEQHEGKAFDTTLLTNSATANIISALLYGRRFEYTDPDFHTTVERDCGIIRLIGSASSEMYSAFPWLGPFLKDLRDMKKYLKESKEEIKHIIADLKENLNPDVCRCIVDAFLVRKLKLKESEIKASQYHDDNLVCSVMDLFLAGTETTATTLRWSLLFMAKYPHIQDKVQEELSRVVGSHQVRIEDRKYLPYTDAVIHETQRLASIIAIIPHQTSQDVTFQGYFIKEGTSVYPLLTSVLCDESEWETPHTFNPSHFLDREGQFIKRDAFMPFSAGRRVCLGGNLARMELFLFFTSLLQRFHFTPPPGVTEDELDLTQVSGLVITPSPHELCAVSLHQ